MVDNRQVVLLLSEEWKNSDLPWLTSQRQRFHRKTRNNFRIPRGLYFLLLNILNLSLPKNHSRKKSRRQAVCTTMKMFNIFVMLECFVKFNICGILLEVSFAHDMSCFHQLRRAQENAARQNYD